MNPTEGIPRHYPAESHEDLQAYAERLVREAEKDRACVLGIWNGTPVLVEPRMDWRVVRSSWSAIRDRLQAWWDKHPEPTEMDRRKEWEAECIRILFDPETPGDFTGPEVMRLASQRTRYVPTEEQVAG